jgi:3-oxoacyl-[acyl-carrier-protein] synthase-3
LRAVEQVRDGLGEVGLIGYHTGLPLNANLGSETEFTKTREIKYCTDYPAGRLQAHFGLFDASVFGLTQQACTGILGLIRLTRALLLTETHLKRGLCITSDRLPPGALYEATYNVLSDGAVGCLVNTTGGTYRVVAVHAITNGAMSLVSADEAVGSYLTYSYRLITELLAMTQLKLSDIAWIVPQNTARAAWLVLSRLLHFDYERVLFPTLGAVGHLVSGDNLVNLMHAQDAGTFKSSDRILLPSAGYGLNWQCLLLEKE